MYELYKLKELSQKYYIPEYKSICKSMANCWTALAGICILQCMRHFQTESGSVGFSGSKGEFLSVGHLGHFMADKYEPNSVGSWHRTQLQDSRRFLNAEGWGTLKKDMMHFF